jgi:hypothetical protein
MVGDQETRDHKKDIDADESSWEAIRPKMEQQHTQDRKRSQRLDLGSDNGNVGTHFAR